ncbi:hypothetical protein KKH23_08420 [Patescibacteria group bacterium]|nr:hypothetical protein [Patescibacteria group bacterium]
MRFYLAAKFPRRREIALYRQQLIDLGHVCDCRWLTNSKHQDEFDNLTTNKPGFNCRLAQEDLADLYNSEALVLFGPGSTRGGCHVEFGVALALNKRIIWIGRRTHVFSYLTCVKVYPDFASFIKELKNNQMEKNNEHPS